MPASSPDQPEAQAEDRSPDLDPAGLNGPDPAAIAPDSPRVSLPVRAEPPPAWSDRLVRWGRDWRDRLTIPWKQRLPTLALPPGLPEHVTQAFSTWFNVGDAQVQEILERIRAELPTTEALLIGKPQSGKSSLVRGLTGVPADIIGQGYRPHTQHTQRYNYPTDDLPLLIFTDTVGLGDASKETAAVVQELMAELAGATRAGPAAEPPAAPPLAAARVMILTVKITDFATDTLRQIAGQLRQAYPQVPCLLVVTCLHELYPLDVTDHPAYPPDLPAGQRAFREIQQGLAGLYDRAVLIDFTLESDGFQPMFYGLEALVTAIADLLPTAEARAMHQLLDDSAGSQLGHLYREAGRRYILPFAVMAAGLAAVPLPFATMPVLTALQGSLVVLLGRLYGQEVTASQAGGIVSAIAGGFLAQAIGRELIKFIPGFGSVIAASWAAAYTWALGEAACLYFGDLMGGKKPDPQRIQAAMKESFAAAQVRFKAERHR